jgi:hypothetical protein
LSLNDCPIRDGTCSSCIADCVFGAAASLARNADCGTPSRLTKDDCVKYAAGLLGIFDDENGELF